MSYLVVICIFHKSTFNAGRNSTVKRSASSKLHMYDCYI
jgi:hypothetical protein